MARNDISFKNVSVPNLSANASLFGASVDAVNKGIAGLKGIATDIQDTDQEQQELKSGLDLDNLRAMAREQLGGQQAGETLEDYNASIDQFLKDNGALTENIGSKNLNAFKTDFEKFVTGQRDTQEARATTLENKRRSDVAYDRAEAEFGRKEVERKANNQVRQIAAAHRDRTEAMKARLRAGETLTPDELRFISTNGNINALESEMRGITNANPVFTDSILNREIGTAERLVLSPAERTALSNRAKQEERFYTESLSAMKFRNNLIKDRIGKLETDIPLNPGDIPGGVQRFNSGLAALTGDNADIKVGDEILVEVQGLMEEMVAQGHHPEDIASAALASTEIAEDIMFFRYDETLDREQFAENLKFAKNARLSKQNQVAALEALGTQTLTQNPNAPATQPAAVPAPSADSGANSGSDVQAPSPAADPTAQSVADLQAAALQAGQPADPRAQAEAEKEAEIVPPLEAKTPAELKAVAITQLNKTEAPKVEANLEAALDKLPSQATATDAQSILRNELIQKLGELRNYIQALSGENTTSEQDALERAVANSGVLTAPTQ